MPDAKPPFAIAFTILAVLWPPLAVLGLHTALSLFGHRRELDPVFHFLGGAAVAFSVTQAFVVFPGWALTRVNRLLVAFFATVAVALLWELAEFMSDRLFGTHVQIDTFDTVSDLALGAAGALVMVAVLLSRARRLP